MRVNKVLLSNSKISLWIFWNSNKNYCLSKLFFYKSFTTYEACEIDFDREFCLSSRQKIKTSWEVLIVRARCYGTIRRLLKIMMDLVNPHSADERYLKPDFKLLGWSVCEAKFSWNVLFLAWQRSLKIKKKQWNPAPLIQLPMGSIVYKKYDYQLPICAPIKMFTWKKSSWFSWKVLKEVIYTGHLAAVFNSICNLTRYSLISWQVVTSYRGKKHWRTT